MTTLTANPEVRAWRRLVSRFSRPVWILAALAAFAVLVAVGARFGAIAEQRHRDALAHLVAEGASIGSPRYGSGVTVYLEGEKFTDSHIQHLRDVTHG